MATKRASMKEDSKADRADDKKMGISEGSKADKAKMMKKKKAKK